MKKGFTLIELLAVIVILAIIALIATPTVVNLIEDSRLKVAIESTNGLFESANIYYQSEVLKSNDKKIEEDIYFICINESCKRCITSSCAAYDENEILKIKGDAPTSGKIKIDTKGVISIVETLVYSGNIYVGYDNNNNLKASKEEQDINIAETIYIGQEIKFDPVNNALCTSGTTCYTWNVIGINDNTVNIMTNTNLAQTFWGAQLDNSQDVWSISLQNLVSSWNENVRNTARIISAQEIVNIIGETELGLYLGYDYSPTDENVCKNYVDCTVDISIYEWLLGTSMESKGEDGDASDIYWTSTEVSTSEMAVYEVRYGLNISTYLGYDPDDMFEKGIRPVVTIDKAILE